MSFYNNMQPPSIPSFLTEVFRFAGRVFEIKYQTLIEGHTLCQTDMTKLLQKNDISVKVLYFCIKFFLK